MSNQEEIEEETALATTGSTDISTDVYDYGEDEDAGYDPDSAGDIQIPRLTILQALSKAIDEVDGAKAGLLYNTVTQEVFKARRFICAKTEKCYNEWIPIDDGGGFVARHEMSSEVVRAARQASPRGAITLDNGNDLVETQYLYVIPVDENNKPLGSFEVIDFTSSKLAGWRQFNTAIQTFTIQNKAGRKFHPPLFAHIVSMSTVQKKGKKGTYYVPLLAAANGTMKSSLLQKGCEAYVAAKNLKESIEAGLMRASTTRDEESQSSSSPESDDQPF